MSIKNFEEFELEHTSVQEKNDDNQNLSDDVTVFQKDADGNIEKLDTKEWEISKIVDVIKDQDEIDDIEKQLSEKNVGFQLSSDLDAKDLKRGDTIYLTAILAPKNKSVAYSPGTMGVIKARIVDMYYGLNKLKSLMGKQ